MISFPSVTSWFVSTSCDLRINRSHYRPPRVDRRMHGVFAVVASTECTHQIPFLRLFSRANRVGISNGKFEWKTLRSSFNCRITCILTVRRTRRTQFLTFFFSLYTRKPLTVNGSNVRALKFCIIIVSSILANRQGF